MSTPLEDDLDLATLAAVAAGQVAMRYFRAGVEVHYKDPDQPVTRADLEADALLRERLLSARPDYGWLSEETADSPARLARDRVWIVDPIDGTNSFIAGTPEFVVSLGLVERGEPVLGVVHNPATGELYTAVRGRGAWLADRRLRVAEPPEPGEEPIFLASGSELRAGELEAYRPGWDIRSLGSTAYRMVKVAEGTGHVFLSAGSKNEWDVCAAALIVTEAGGDVYQIGGRALRFNQPEPVFDGIVASCGVSPDPGRPAA